MVKINLITILLISIFGFPLLTGLLHPFSGNIRHALLSVLNSLEWCAEIVVSIGLAKLIFSDYENKLLSGLYAVIPSVRDSVFNQDIWIYLIASLILLFFVHSIIRLLKIPLYRFAAIPWSDRIASRFHSMSSAGKRIIGGIWELPKSIFLVLAFSLLFHLYAGYAKNTALGVYISCSATYRLVDSTVLEPMLRSGLANEIPLLFYDSFEKAVENTSANQLTAITYFNGVSLKEAVKSSDEIDNLTQKIVAAETDAKQKAYLIYEWICTNIKYDYDKADALDVNPSAVSSGSLTAYRTGTGVCFDYSCLYVSMCRTAGLEVRFVAGSGYSGGTWENHAWNQVYDPGECRWFNVDTTYGSSGGNYFDNADFSDEHSDGIVMGEW